jgi:hypothetical protein
VLLHGSERDRVSSADGAEVHGDARWKKPTELRYTEKNTDFTDQTKTGS